MNKKQFMKLKSGDVILWKSGSTIIHRTIIEGPGDFDDPRKQAITLPILRRSWTRRGTTVRFWNDVKHLIVGKQAKRAEILVNKGEIFALLRWHEKPSELVERELKNCRRVVSRPVTEKQIMRRAARTHSELRGVGL